MVLVPSWAMLGNNWVVFAISKSNAAAKHSHFLGLYLQLCWFMSFLWPTIFSNDVLPSKMNVFDGHLTPVPPQGALQAGVGGTSFHTSTKHRPANMGNQPKHCRSKMPSFSRQILFCFKSV